MTKAPSTPIPFSIGDQVVLRSGGPVMTVKHSGESELVCQWFAGKKLEMGRFAPESITTPVPKP